MDKVRCGRFIISSLFMALMQIVPATGLSDEGLLTALTKGHFDLFMRYRYEFVEDGNPDIENAYASTLRIAPGYRTGDYYDTSLYFQLEDVVRVGSDSYDDGVGPPSGRAIVPDPEGFELKQAYIHYAGLPRTVFTVGRQYINHRQVPFNRFIGDQGWRQHFQAFDAARAVTLAIPNAVAEYAYTWNVNRANGERNRSPDGSDFPMNSHWLNFQYSGMALAKLEQYLYLLDFTSDASARLSTVTAGLRMAGDRVIFPATRLLYVGEYAYQGDYADNPNTINANYAVGQLALARAFDGPVETATLSFAYELLGGKGGVNAFQTPLATLHVFQGFADRFVVTPGDGVADMHGGLSLKILGSNLGIIYHNFKADHLGYTYGNEWDIAFERPIAQSFLIGVQYADYQADDNERNRYFNSKTGQAFDMNRFWTYIQFMY